MIAAVPRHSAFGRDCLSSASKAARRSPILVMLDPVRQEIIALASTIVVKVGTNVLTGADGTLDRNRLQSLADQVQRIRRSGRKVALVSSGAIGAGMGRLGLGKRPTG